MFTDILQIGIVVRDIDATIARYEAYGIGPWSEVMSFGPDRAEEYREGGHPGRATWRVASTMLGSVMWELIQPAGGEGIYARYLADHGEGIQHIAVRVSDFDDVVAAHAAAGNVPPLAGTFMGVRIAYLDTVPDLGVMLETGDLPEYSGDDAPGEAPEPALRSEPESTPPFTDTLQIGVVVRDLEASIAQYESYGVGPWGEFMTIGPDTAPDLRVHGEPLRGSCRASHTMIGSVMWELIEPLDNEGIYAEFLAKHGEGVHHVAVGVADFAATIADQESRGKPLLLSGSHSGIPLAFLDTQSELGVPLEVADLPDDFMG